MAGLAFSIVRFFCPCAPALGHGQHSDWGGQRSSIRTTNPKGDVLPESQPFPEALEALPIYTRNI